MIMECRRRQRRRLPLRCWRGRRGIIARAMFRRRLEPANPRCWGRSAMSRRKWIILGVALAVGCAGCRQGPPSGNTVTMLIESSPANLDPRIGTDGQSEHIDSLIFDALTRRDEHFNVQPWLAKS